jgi:predicted RNA-binding protein with PIN domain
MHIVVVGYNLIRQSPYFSSLERRDLESGRRALLKALAAYKKIKSYTITVVFDGKDAPVGMPRRDRCHGIELRYSGPGELADTVIKRMANREGQGLMVVSSDNEVIHHAMARGAGIISAAEFEERLLMTQMMASKGAMESEPLEGWAATTKKRGPAKRLPKRQRQIQRKINKL